MNTTVMMQVMDACRRHFIRSFYEREFDIVGGAIAGIQPKAHELVIIKGSANHDGLWKVEAGADDSAVLVDADALGDETFVGKVFLVSPPLVFRDMCEGIDKWLEKNPDSPMTSESFGGYSYTRATGAHGAVTWQEAFAPALSMYRMPFDDLEGEPYAD